MFARDIDLQKGYFMNYDQKQIQNPPNKPSTGKWGKEKLKERHEFMSELKALQAASKSTFRSGDRMAVHGLLETILNQVSQWEAEERLEKGLYALLDTLRKPVPLKLGEAFNIVIYCVAPKLDQKSRSKWARVLRYAAAEKLPNESLREFINRMGGINACAAEYARQTRSPPG
jgi:hypothetical protein